jgi:hypothetical protein
MTRSILLWSLIACVPSETGIDNSRIDGTVRLLPVTATESNELQNRDPDNAEALPTVSPAAVIVSAALLRSSVDPDGTPTGDVDHYALSTDVDLPDYALYVTIPSGSARVELLDLGSRPVRVLSTVDVSGSAWVPFPAPPTPVTTTTTTTTDTGDTGALDTGVVDTGLTDTGTPLTDTGYYTTSTTPPLTGPGMAQGVAYGLRVSGLSGDDGSTYEVVLPGSSPDDTPVLVGAWLEGDIAERTDPVGGTNASGWTGGGLADGWVWTGTYSVYLVRDLETEVNTEGDEEVVGANEELEQIYLFAGTWASLNQGLPAGTWYSSTPQAVVLNQEPRSLLATDAAVYEAAPLQLDTFAPVVIGFETAETEPNDIGLLNPDAFPPAIDPAALSAANSAGALSGPGFVDVFRGDLGLNGVGYGANDIDAWGFTVAEPSSLLLTLGWDAPSADLDLFVVDAAGEIVEGVASYDNPELGGGEWTFVPGETYTLIILGYLGDAGTSTAYELTVEQAAP